jgi:hypothetical protein
VTVTEEVVYKIIQNVTVECTQRIPDEHRVRQFVLSSLGIVLKVAIWLLVLSLAG